MLIVYKKKKNIQPKKLKWSNYGNKIIKKIVYRHRSLHTNFFFFLQLLALGIVSVKMCRFIATTGSVSVKNTNSHFLFHSEKRHHIWHQPLTVCLFLLVFSAETLPKCFFCFGLEQVGSCNWFGTGPNTCTSATTQTLMC